MTQDEIDQYEHNTHVFVIKIWLEDASRWRGHITHIPNGERRYFEELDEMRQFIQTYLEKMGFQRSLVDKLCERLKRRRPRRRTTGMPKQNHGAEA